MASLGDRLPFLVGDKAAGQLEEYFGIRTVNDLVRYFPRKYSDAMTTRGEGEELDLEEGEHVTFVDEITDADARWTKREPKREYLVITLGDRRPKVTATFFNARFLKKQLVKRTRVMLSGEVGYFKGTMQLTHPAFLVLDSGQGQQVTGRHRLCIDGIRRRLALGVRTGILPGLSGQLQDADLGHLRVCAPGARRAGSDRRDDAELVCART